MHRFQTEKQGNASGEYSGRPTTGSERSGHERTQMQAEEEVQSNGGSEGGVVVNLCAGPTRLTGEVQVINANAPGSTLYRVDARKVCNLAREEESYRMKKEKLDLFMHHPFPEKWWNNQDYRRGCAGTAARGASIFDGYVTDFHKVVLCNMALYLREETEHWPTWMVALTEESQQ